MFKDFLSLFDEMEIVEDDAMFFKLNFDSIRLRDMDEEEENDTDYDDFDDELKFVEEYDYEEEEKVGS